MVARAHAADELLDLAVGGGRVVAEHAVEIGGPGHREILVGVIGVGGEASEQGRRGEREADPVVGLRDSAGGEEVRRADQHGELVGAAEAVGVCDGRRDHAVALVQIDGDERLALDVRGERVGDGHAVHGPGDAELREGVLHVRHVRAQLHAVVGEQDVLGRGGRDRDGRRVVEGRAARAATAGGGEQPPDPRGTPGGSVPERPRRPRS